MNPQSVVAETGREMPLAPCDPSTLSPEVRAARRHHLRSVHLESGVDPRCLTMPEGMSLWFVSLMLDLEVHAGWRGTAAGIAGEAVSALARLGVEPSTLVAAIGPSIRACCYQVDARVRDVFASEAGWRLAEPSFAPDGPGHWRLDVAAINRRMLEAAGVPADQIFDSELCTACDLKRFYSYRVEGVGTGRLVAGIAVS